MRFPIVFLAALVAACSHTVTLFPRGGGEQATGTLNDGSQNMEIVLKAETYTGSYVLGQTFGFGMGQTFGARPTFGTVMMVGNTNQATALLTSASGKNVLRCEFVLDAASGGNGVCVDKDNVTYDMLAKSN